MNEVRVTNREKYASLISGRQAGRHADQNQPTDSLVLTY